MMIDINPDADINVCDVLPNGTVRIYAPLFKGQTVRTHVDTRYFSNYGNGALWAVEYEQRARDSRPIARR